MGATGSGVRFPPATGNSAPGAGSPPPNVTPVNVIDLPSGVQWMSTPDPRKLGLPTPAGSDERTVPFGVHDHELSPARLRIGRTSAALRTRRVITISSRAETRPSSSPGSKRRSCPSGRRHRRCHRRPGSCGGRRATRTPPPKPEFSVPSAIWNRVSSVRVGKVDVAVDGIGEVVDRARLLDRRRQPDQSPDDDDPRPWRQASRIRTKIASLGNIAPGMTRPSGPGTRPSPDAEDRTIEPTALPNAPRAGLNSRLDELHAHVLRPVVLEPGGNDTVEVGHAGLASHAGCPPATVTRSEASMLARIARRAWCRRDPTVPYGMSRMSAISARDMPT